MLELYHIVLDQEVPRTDRYIVLAALLESAWQMSMEVQLVLEAPIRDVLVLMQT